MEMSSKQLDADGVQESENADIVLVEIDPKRYLKLKHKVSNTLKLRMKRRRVGC